MSTYDAGAARLDPDAVKELPRTTRPVGPGGLTLPVLALAALVSSPAIYQCLVRHAIPTHVMLERYVLIALGCLLVSEVARRVLRPVEERSADAPGAEQPGPAGETLAAGAVPDADPSAPFGGSPEAVDPALALLAGED